jgi:asparagine synthase (glutamine-hydrolysing)
MSAIAGVLQLDGSPAEAQVIRAMVARIAHRGPDGSGTFVDGPVALGHLLLQVTPESIGERQPLASPESGSVITFDGRIDNRDELWEALSVPPHERGEPDAALVLRAHEKWGGECPVRLLGEFVFAIWDPRRSELFCARDAFGARDLFYRHGAGRFAFSSEINAVLAVPGVPMRLDEQAFARQLGALRGLGERTLYDGVLRLPPAHSLILRPGSPVSPRRYWQLSMEPELHLRSSEEYAEALRELITKAVSARLRSNHPISVTLSGGLDSSGVACLAARELSSQGRRLLAVSNVLPDDFQGSEWLGDERDFIQAVHAQEQNVDACMLRGGRFPAIDFDDRILDRLGQPFSDPFAYRTREMAAAAEDRGARVLLGGLGGDMAASLWGKGWLAILAHQGRLPELLRQARLQGRAQGVSPLWLLKGEVLRSFIPHRARRWRTRLRLARDRGWDGTAVHPDFAKRMGLDELRRELELDDPPQDTRRSILRVELTGWIASQNAFVASYCDTIEGPQPLMDRRIWEFAYRVPLGQFCADGMPRGLYRRAMAGILPEKIRLRQTKGWFAPDYRQRMLACRPQIREFLEAHKPGDPIWEYLHRPSIELVLLQLERPDPPNEWNTSYQLVLGRGLRMAHFLSWLRRKA